MSTVCACRALRSAALGRARARARTHTHTFNPCLQGAALGGAKVVRGAIRVVLGGWAAMVVTYGIGYAFGVSAA